MNEPDTLFIAQILYKKTVIVNGKGNPVMSTIRIIKAQDREGAIEKLKAFWQDKMRSYSILQSEITSIIE